MNLESPKLADEAEIPPRCARAGSQAHVGRQRDPTGAMLALAVAATGGAMSPAAPVLASQFPSLHNLRDLGGTPCGGANVIAPARVLRAASPADVSQEDFSALLARLPGLRVVDLRSEADALEDEGARLLVRPRRPPSRTCPTRASPPRLEHGTSWGNTARA